MSNIREDIKPCCREFLHWLERTLGDKITGYIPPYCVECGGQIKEGSHDPSGDAYFVRCTKCGYKGCLQDSLDMGENPFCPNCGKQGGDIFQMAFHQPKRG